MALLAVDELHAGYGDVKILHGASITVEDGEIVTIIGPNGAGKSTLMKAVFGLVRPTAGRIPFLGEDVTGARPDALVRRGMAYVPQNQNVFPRLTVRENLELGAFIARGGLDEALARVYELFPPLREKQKKKAGVLSGGEQQMVAIGRALMLSPKLLLLDEPTAGLAPLFARLILEKAREINAAGVGILLVEQNARAALAISHRAYVLTMGRNRAQGPARELLADREVAELFLGG